MEKSLYQLDIEEQLRNLKQLVGNVAEKPDPIEIAKVTIASAFVMSRVKEFCRISLTQGARDGMDGAAA